MKWWKWIARVVGGLAVLIVIVVLTVYLLSQREINKTYALTPPNIAIPTDSVSLARGKHLVTSIGKCGECHGDNLAGKVFIDDPALGRLYSRNITSGKGGIGTRYSEADLVRVLRYGVKADGTSLLFMPTREYAQLSDADLGALVAYVRSVPAVDHEVPRSSLGPIGRMLLVTKKSPEILPTRFVSHATTAIPSVPEGVTVEYGKYLANTGGCTACHGATLAGGPIPGVPPEWPAAANLTRGGIGATWSEEDFTHALREGYRPDKTVISAVMPWKYTRFMTDDEIRAIWRYIQSVPAVPSKS